MSSRGGVILSSAYFPSIDYFAAIAASDSILLEQYESYQKQSYRNRCYIFATDGVFPLSIPVVKGNIHTPIRDVLIDYSKPWLQQHQRAIVSSYRSSAFFIYYQDDLFPILEKREKYLFDLNLKLTEKLLFLLGFKRNINLSQEYIHESPTLQDFREAIHPKRKSPIFAKGIKELKPYYQVFSDKLGFKSNLSIIDLLFNEGPNSISFL